MLNVVPAVHVVPAAYIIPAGQHILSAASEAAAFYCCDMYAGFSVSYR